MFLWIVSFCNVSNRVPTTLYLRSLYTQISPMSRVHTRRTHTHKGKTHLTRLSVWSPATGSGPQPPEATCRDLWMEVVLKLVAVALVKVPQPMSMWVGSNHLIWQYLAWIDTVFSRLVKQMASNQSQTVLLLFLDIVYDTYHVALTNTKLSSSWLSFSFSKTAGSRGGTSRHRFQHSRCWAELSTMRWIIKLIAVNFLLWRSNIKLPPQKSKWFDGVVCCFSWVIRSTFILALTRMLENHTFNWSLCRRGAEPRYGFEASQRQPNVANEPMFETETGKNDLKCK